MRKLTLSEVENSTSSTIYAINETKGEMRSQIILNTHKLNGAGVDTVVIAASWIPQELTGQVPKPQLLASSDFRRAVTSGWICLVSEDDAGQMLQQTGAKEELNKIVNMNKVVDESTQSAMSDIETNTFDDTNEQALESTVAMKVSPAVLSVFADVEEGVIEELEALNRLRNLGELTKDTLEYIREQSKNYKFRQMNNWVKPLLQ